MKVIATDTGFYNGRRVRRGEEFDVPEGTKARWFVATETKEAKATKADVKKDTKPQPTALSQIGKEAPKSMTEVMAGKEAPLA